MIKKIILLLCFFSVTAVSAQYKGVVVSKVTATWCPNCGSWGWDYFEALRNLYQNQADVCLLGVHHSGDLLNPVSNWFSGNLNNSYQPEFYVNNEQIDVLSFNWNSKIDELRDKVDSYTQEIAFVDFDFINAYVESGEIICNVNFGASAKATGDYYFAVYVFENAVENFQSSLGMTIHPNVLRAVFGSSDFGNLYASSGQVTPVSQQEFKMALNGAWNKDNLGLLAVMWRQDGNSYIVDNAQSIYNIGFLSSTEDIDESLFKLKYVPVGVILEADSFESKLSYQLFDNAGHRVDSGALSGSKTFQYASYPAGIYTLMVQKEGKFLSRQLVLSSN